MPIDAYFFDLDGTLYDSSCGLMKQVNHRIDEWILKTVPMPEADVPAFRHDLFTRYGGTLPGLTIEYGSDYYASLRYCHDVPVETFIRPDPVLCGVLEKLPGRKYVFTSGYRFYAKRVTDALGITGFFDGFIDAVDVYPAPKPFLEAYRRALQITAEADARRCVFFDDQPRNVAAGHEAGFFAVQVGTDYPVSDLADAQISAVSDLLTIPELQLKG